MNNKLDNSVRNGVEQFILELKLVDKWCRTIINKNLVVEYIDHRIGGVSSPRFKDVVIENKNPYSVGKIYLIDKKDKELRAIDFERSKILQIKEKFDLIDDCIEKSIMVDLYLLRMNSDQVANKYYLSRSTMYDNVKSKISEMIESSDTVGEF